jgi:hypothetical protein
MKYRIEIVVDMPDTANVISVTQGISLMLEEVFTVDKLTVGQEAE